MVPKLVAGNRVLAELGFGLASNYLERGYFQSWINCIPTSYKSAFASDAALARLHFLRFSQVSVSGTLHPQQ